LNFLACFTQQIPGVSPLNRYTTLIPLSIVILISAIKEIIEDWVGIAERYPATLSDPKVCYRNVTNRTEKRTRGCAKF
jgi:hypothetical protein